MHHGVSKKQMKRPLPLPSNDWQAIAGDTIAATMPRIPRELLKGVLYEGGTMMMSGASKSMKTFTMIAAGLAVASGSDWLGIRCATAPVVYLNLELQDFAMAQRVIAVAKAMNISPPGTFHVVNLRGLLVDINTVESKLDKLIAQTGARLVVIDPHYKISSASHVEENSNDEQGLLLYRLENAVCKSGAALMVAHHFSKGDKSQVRAIDRAAGGGALARWPDVVMTLTEHEVPDCAAAEFSLRNFAPLETFTVRWAYPLWTLAPEIDPTLLKKAGRKVEFPAEKLLQHLDKENGMTNAEWAKASNYAETTVRRRCKELLAAGLIRVSASKRYYAVTPE